MSVITISNGVFSGGREFAEAVAEKLDYRCVHRETLLSDAARKYGVSERSFQEAIRNVPHFWQRMSARNADYIIFARATLYNVVKEDNIVYDGQTGHYLLAQIPHVLKVMAVADMETRLRSAMTNHNFTRDDASKFIKEADDQLSQWMKAIYQIEWMDPVRFNITLNLSGINRSRACDLIDHLSKDFQTTQESQQMVDDLAMSYGIKAQIASDKSIKERDVDIRADSGLITVNGAISQRRNAEEIREIIRRTPGVREIDFNVKVKG